MKTIHKDIFKVFCLILATVIFMATMIFTEAGATHETEVVTHEETITTEQPTTYTREPITAPEPIVIFAPSENGETDWKTCIVTEDIDILNNLFGEYENPQTMYATTGVHMRTYPNTGSESITVLTRNTEVTAVADFNGWTRVLTEEGNHYYVWNQYLSTEKQNDLYLGNFKLTAYCSCTKCCGKWSGGPTASGAYPVAGRTVAMAGVPFGTKLSINGHIYTVEDRGTPYGHVDIYFDSHSEALKFGMKYADVYVIE